MTRNDQLGVCRYATMRASLGTILFREDADYFFFLRLLTEGCRRYDVKVHAFCLIPDSGHVVWSARKEGPLEAIEHHILDSYEQYLRRRYRPLGPVWQARLRNVRIDPHGDLAMYLQFLAFIPVQSGLCRSPAEYPWSSCPDRLSASRTAGPAWGTASGRPVGRNRLWRDGRGFRNMGRGGGPGSAADL